jgi:hypothetical protein
MSYLRSLKAAIKYQELMKTNIKHCQIIFQFDLEFGPGKIKKSVGFNSTLDQ